MATTTHAASSGGLRVQVQKFGTFLSNMVLPNIGAFIAWGLITALFIETGWITLVGERVFGYEGGYGFVEDLGGWGAGSVENGGLGGIVGIMIRFLLPILIGYTGGKMMYDDSHRGGVVGAIATFGAIAGTGVPMFLGAMIMGPLGGWSMKKLDALWAHKIRPGFEMLVNNYSAGFWGMILALGGFLVAGPVVEKFSDGAGNVVDFLVEHSLMPLASVFIEPAKVLFLNNAINQGVLTPLGTAEALEDGKSVLFLLEANPGPGLGLLLAFMFFGKGAARASAPGAAIIHFIGGIHEIYFPYVLMKPKLIIAMIAGGASGIAINLLFDSGLRSAASPGSIISIWISSPPSSLFGVTLSVIVAAAVTFFIASLLLKTDRTDDEGDLAAATAQMESTKGKKSSVAAMLTGAAADSAPIRSIVFACDAGMGSSAMGASVLRKKIKDAGFPEITVTNKAISNLTDDIDLVVTHQDLTARAQQRTPSATHVSVENFMSSPRYDEIVALVQKQHAGGATASAPAAAAPDLGKAESDPGAGGSLLPEGSLVLDAPSESRDEAITRAGALLVASGAADQAYADAMHTREGSVSTYMGNLLAIPHGTNDAKSGVSRTAITFVRYAEPVDWKGKEVRFVIGIASAGNEHLKLLAKIAEIFVDADQVARLEAAGTEAEVRAILGALQPA